MSVQKSNTDRTACFQATSATRLIASSALITLKHEEKHNFVFVFQITYKFFLKYTKLLFDLA